MWWVPTTPGNLKNPQKVYSFSEVGIYKRKQASKKTRKKTRSDQKKEQEKKKVSFFLGRFLGRERVFGFVFSCFLL